ncbi:MAG: 6-phosphogluconolactonase [Pseudohongiella sp.]|nr:6-phosphogluconolactonase [Pseudohongiella sp.]MDP2128250.1 6-phosphogluconolactonase [Pseudohongiella sp.]
MALINREFATPQALVDELSMTIASRLECAIQQQGHASLAVSGGSTPGPLFNALSLIDLPWAQVVISLVDERWVDENHPDSNAAMVRRNLLKNYASTARLVTMKINEADAFVAQKKVNHLLENSILPLDIVLLGMGTDGHTASLFPDAEGLAQALDVDDTAICCGIRVTGMPYTRMTLTLRTLLNARCRILHIQGMSKKQTLLKALEPGPIAKMPVKAVLESALADTEIYYSP